MDTPTHQPLFTESASVINRQVKFSFLFFNLVNESKRSTALPFADYKLISQRHGLLQLIQSDKVKKEII